MTENLSTIVDKIEWQHECQHEWVQAPYVLTTNPPTFQFICRKCGAKKRECGEFVDCNEYFRIEEKFK